MSITHLVFYYRKKYKVCIMALTQFASRLEQKTYAIWRIRCEKMQTIMASPRHPETVPCGRPYLDVCRNVLKCTWYPIPALTIESPPAWYQPQAKRLDTTQKGYQRMMKPEDIIILAQMKRKTHKK